ncbi:MAG: hypothetical protein M1823_000783 [Watsoniomyces obsoletus]|nr:MAG: hypothetical protein M1823_000783 [Watsoniomyces obsoletus]
MDLPRFLQRYVLPLRTAPLTHISSFLILHEITAVVPLLALTGIFHYTQWLPPYISEGKWVSIGMDKFGRYFRKKGWLKEDGRMTRWWGRGETGFKLVAEVATAWAITKALLPLRLILSVWATPWFARAAVMPSMARFKQLWVMITRRGGPPKSGAAGTGATGGRVVAKTPSGQIKKGE